ncbi:aspergillopepsin-2 precursor like protein [Zymoseptoria brevis]|uniref:Aspergillopepsin-2 like protein n=1 Tax=Zymoseptoria brevis TaxID=1047168 RepID=A0A0F4GM39_9PEZI|nr:aspergillopepsin-2 precursor like protein [Zymoseptoria brevis]
MKLCVVAGGLLLSCLVAAATPPNSGLRSPERRQAGRRSGLRPRDSGLPQTDGNDGWAGAVHSGNEITEVSGSFILPKLSRPVNADAERTYIGTAWVGIDGDEKCPSHIIQAGVDFHALPDGSTEYSPWSEWFPGGLWTFSSLTELKAGDEVSFLVKADSATSGTAQMSIPSTGETWTHTYTDQPVLCRSSAEWIVENLLDYDDDRQLVVQPLVVFSDLTFTGAKFKHDGGVESGAAGSELTAVEIGGVVRADAEVAGEDRVVVKYIRSV